LWIVAIAGSVLGFDLVALRIDASRPDSDELPLHGSARTLSPLHRQDPPPALPPEKPRAPSGTAPRPTGLSLNRQPLEDPERAEERRLLALARAVRDRREGPYGPIEDTGTREALLGIAREIGNYRGFHPFGPLPRALKVRVKLFHDLIGVKQRPSSPLPPDETSPLNPRVPPPGEFPEEPGPAKTDEKSAPPEGDRRLPDTDPASEGPDAASPPVSGTDAAPEEPDAGSAPEKERLPTAR
jgi:hypothetical protein